LFTLAFILKNQPIKSLLFKMNTSAFMAY